MSHGTAILEKPGGDGVKEIDLSNVIKFPRKQPDKVEKRIGNLINSIEEGTVLFAFKESTMAKLRNTFGDVTAPSTID